MPLGSRFVDPLSLKPVRLSVGAMQWWAARSVVSPVSPITTLLSVPLADDAKNPIELQALGIPVPSGAVEPSPSGKFYDEALHIVADPEALLDLSELTPGAEPLTARLLIGKGKAVLCDLDAQGLTITSPMLVAELVRALARHFENTHEAAPAPVVLWRSQLALLAPLFCTQARSLELEVPRAQAFPRLAPLGLSAADVAVVVSALEGAGLISATEAALSLQAAAAFWLRRVATATIGELTLETYSPEGVTTRANTQVRFVGAAGERVTAVNLTGADLQKLVGDQPPEEPSAVAFSALNKDGLVALLETFIGA